MNRLEVLNDSSDMFFSEGALVHGKGFFELWNQKGLNSFHVFCSAHDIDEEKKVARSLSQTDGLNNEDLCGLELSELFVEEGALVV